MSFEPRAPLGLEGAAGEVALDMSAGGERDMIGEHIAFHVALDLGALGEKIADQDRFAAQRRRAGKKIAFDPALEPDVAGRSDIAVNARV